MSDGCASLAGQEEPFEIFPSLPDAVLEKMGLMNDGPKERLNEEELEQKFVGLALAFSIDAATIKDRCERQRRYRDQTEKNLNVEIDRLTDRANKMQPLCVDAETTELLTDLLAQIDVVSRASSHATISAERFGAVQYEDRLSQGVHLMINHVTVLKQQRDSARKHLQYTKRVLQNTHSEEAIKPRSPPAVAPALNRRRASIASITQKSMGGIENKRNITRRPSDMSFRAIALPRINRPSRLELGVDLVKIREGKIEGMETPQPEDCPENILLQPEEEEGEEEGKPNENNETSQVEQIKFSELSSKDKFLYKLRKLKDLTSAKYKNWTEDGTLHELFIVGALLCFTFSIITMGNVIIELEFAKRNITDNYSINEFWTDLTNYIKRLYGDSAVVT